MAKKKKKSSFRGKTGKDAQRQKQRGSSYGYLNLPKGLSVFSPKPGSRVWLDIMPYVVTDKKHPDRDEENGIAVVGELWYKRPFRIHRNIGPDNDAVVCLASFGKKCPICDYRSKLMKDGAEKEETDALKVSFRNLYVVIPKKNDEYEVEPHVMDISQYLFQNLLNDELEEDEDYEGFPELEDGYTLKIRFDSTVIGSSKPFAEASRIDFVKRKEAYDEEILEDVPDLDSLLTEMTFEAMEQMFFEIDDEEEDNSRDDDDDDNDDEEGKSKRKKKSKKKKKPAPVDDDDDDDGPAPKVKRNKRKEKVVKGKGKCPHGYKYGKDTDKHEECDDCKNWDTCIDKKEEDE